MLTQLLLIAGCGLTLVGVAVLVVSMFLSRDRLKEWMIAGMALSCAGAMMLALGSIRSMPAAPTVNDQLATIGRHLQSIERKLTSGQ